MATSNLYNVLSALNETDGKLWSKTLSLSSAISGEVDALAAKVSPAFTADRIAVGSGTGLSASTLSLGADSDTTLAGTNTIATEAAVKAYVGTVSGNLVNSSNEAVSDLSGKVSSAFGTGSYVVTSKDGGIEKSAYTIGTTTSGSFGTANKLATEAGAQNYTDGQIDILSGAVSAELQNLSTNAATYSLVAGTTTEGYASTYELKETKNGNTTSVGKIDIPKDQFLSAAVYNAATESIDLTFAVAGAPAPVNIPVSGLVHEFEGVSGVAIDYNANGTKSQIKGVVDTAKPEAYLKLGADGFYLSGIDSAIATAKSEAIEAANGSANTGLAALSGRMTTAEDNIGTLSSGLGTATGNITTLSSDLGTATGNITTLSSGLGTVSGKVADIDAKTSGSITSNHLVKGDASGNYVDAGVIAGSDSTLSGDFGTANTLATEAATKTYISGAIEAKVGSAAYIPYASATNNNVAIFAANGHEVADSGKTVGTGSVAAADFGSATVLTTEKDVETYVNDGLAALLISIGTLQDKIDTLQA